MPGSGKPRPNAPGWRAPRSGSTGSGTPRSRAGRGAPWREDDDFFGDDEPRRGGAYSRDALPPWREALRRKARAEADTGVPWRKSRAEADTGVPWRKPRAEADTAGVPRRKPPREPASRTPRGAGGRPRAGAASSRRSAPAPKHSTATARRVSTGPRKIVRKTGGNHHLRVVSVRFLLIAALVAAGLKLIQVQGFEAEALAAKAEDQRSTEIDIPAMRGSIVDRTGMKLAFSVESRVLAFQPRRIRESIAKHNKEHPDAKLSFDERTEEIARYMRKRIGDRASESDLLEKLRRDVNFVYLIDEVEPAIARDITTHFPEVNSEYRAVREYPGRSLASNIVGVANWRMDNPDVKKHNLHGLSGLESMRDNELSGTPGRQTVDTKEGSLSLVIPGTERDLQPAIDGSDIELTIDADLQYFLQQALADYVVRSEAKGASAVIMDSRTGEVYALANDTSFDPTKPLDTKTMGNPAVSTPYEPGSVHKIVTALCAIENDITEPDDVHQVDGAWRVADRTIRDAWPHGTLPFTTTGIFAKSSNVGTLMLAEECGEDTFADLMKRLGLGQRTGIGLPGESPGQVPPRGQWSGSTFGNLPIGQGLSMTVLQMAAMYQTIANGGVRVPPRIVSARVDPDGTRVPEPKPKGVRVVSEETADTVRDMFRAVVQDGDGLNDGTGTSAALTGYQISGKTGTGQQIDPVTKSYSNDLYWITFAGILPADDPRFVVGIMLDRPNYTGGELEGRSAAPLFHDVASYLAQRYNIPLSKKATPIVPLIAE